MSDHIPYPYIEFALTVGTWDVVELAYADTGFEGGLLIPIGAGLEILARPRRGKFALPDGYIAKAPAWDGVIDLEGYSFSVEVAAIGERYLLGREVLDQLEVTFSFGREVRLQFAD